MRNLLMGAASMLACLGAAAHAEPAGTHEVKPHLSQVRIYVADIPRSERFYEETLNMRVAAELSDAEHALVFPGAPEGPGVLLLQADAEAPQANGAIVVRVGDVDGILARAVELGGKVVRPAQSGPIEGTRYAMFSDYDGAIIQVTQFPEGVGRPARQTD